MTHTITICETIDDVLLGELLLEFLDRDPTEDEVHEVLLELVGEAVLGEAVLGEAVLHRLPLHPLVGL